MNSAVAAQQPVSDATSRRAPSAAAAFPRSRALVLHRWRRLALLGLPLTTGAALTAYIVFGVVLPVAAGLLAAAGIAGWIVVIPTMTGDQRDWIRSRVGTGLRGGLLAVAAYDLTRYGVVAVAALSFQPFHVFRRFGEAIFGPGITDPAATVAGGAFHLANGLGFAVAFALAVPRPNVRLGVAWALCLETLMLLMYPSWLGVSLTGELLPVSIAGHLAFGSVLGLATRRSLTS
jgi:hypothetical protein